MMTADDERARRSARSVNSPSRALVVVGLCGLGVVLLLCFARLTTGDPAPLVPGEARSQSDIGIVSCGSVVSPKAHSTVSQEPVLRLAADLRKDACDNARSLRLFGLILMSVTASAMVVLGCLRRSTGARSMLVWGVAVAALFLFAAALWLSVFARSSFG